ncbi:hypothetical protein [Pseudonocardia asaccharolytica]|uniref:Uncharacterized protein n=1 Tax=Pseudonocardia asaccharolytica DSM 44247 = NBRC 16224 TaxID=1123024 RepID=A0A511D3F5_9PSEU|nr:hypothetical protein [Pseudonocardia asaccharolytica]GEL19310.1 hypothetical protein PA7_31470 [Pseudonocardia asaccharolytica DSM 44247 = NBRC 16224]
MSANELVTAEVLRRAADLIEQRAAKATPGPWRVRYTDRYGWPIDMHADDDDEGTLTLVAGTALPRANGRDPGHYESQHIIATSEPSDLYPGMEQFAELHGNHEWIATMSPQIARPLAAWLRLTAAGYEQYPLNPAELEGSAPVRLARVILGETT